MPASASTTPKSPPGPKDKLPDIEKPDFDQCPSCTEREKRKKAQQKACQKNVKDYAKTGSTIGGVLGTPGKLLGGTIGVFAAAGTDDCQYGYLNACPPGATYTPAHMENGELVRQTCE